MCNKNKIDGTKHCCGLIERNEVFDFLAAKVAYFSRYFWSFLFLLLGGLFFQTHALTQSALKLVRYVCESGSTNS